MALEFSVVIEKDEDGYYVTSAPRQRLRMEFAGQERKSAEADWEMPCDAAALPRGIVFLQPAARSSLTLPHTGTSYSPR